MKWTTDRIRQSFLDFFEARGHSIVPSAPLIPKGDPTLLFTNAGMVPFKDYFLGIRTPASRRVADCQKCLRISGKHNDLEAVGRDSYHHTFFEMLGNWSFGDYYKAEAIPWHWELVTKVWDIPSEKLWATVYKDDDEAFGIWEKIPDLPRGRILRFGEKDNFWEMGETGPCGPCSEIHIDRGEEAAKFCDHPEKPCGVNIDGCARFIELGNLVFIQYNRDASGKLTPLPMRHVDTGTGLERVTSVMQSLESGRLLGNYNIDLFQTIIAAIQKSVLSIGNREKYNDSGSEDDVSYRAIADHARTISFLIADGILPGNTDREYVLRRLIRRSARHGRQLGIEQPFLAGVANAVGDAMGKAYPELLSKASKIRKVVTDEETRFGETLDRGLELIDTEIGRLEGTSKNVLPGEVAFKLYDTYGFPLDLTEDVLRNRDFVVDTAGFDRLMEEQRERGRAARVKSGDIGLLGEEANAYASVPSGDLQHASSKFVGAHTYRYESEISASVVDLLPERPIRIITAETPFYPEGGGQTGDRGIIETESGALAEIVDTRKHNGAILHVGRILRGEPGDFQPGQLVKLQIDRERRDAAMLNHSATHILHYALREILGNEVHQAGSMVAPERLRFDFNHQGAIGEGDLRTIEEEINARIRENAEVTVEEMPYDDALKAGALAFFGDKYGDVVRVVRMGDFSVELCGGTHVNRTGDVGLFKLETEAGVAAGVRRIEAYTGQGALDAIRRREQILEKIGGHLGARDAAALDRLQRLLAREKELEKKLRALEQKLVNGVGAAATDERVRDVHGVKVVTRKVDGVEARALREMADRMRQKYGSAVVALGSDLGENKAALLVAVTADLARNIKAGDIIKQIAPIVGGTGGGRPDFAQAGGHDPSKLDEALDRVATLV
ncbi:MAG TPA: alanine--tRNA ligase [Candidatus Binataceae bacterium]|nr:alanine--tRNA ligase [Candidatus Binataceae bacterium]